MQTIKPLDKIVNSSRFNLATTAFDITNYRSAGLPANSTLDADTPKGVLGASVAEMNDDWEVINGDYLSDPVIGLFAGNSEGNAFENAPAAASGVVPVYMGPGSTYDVYVFETHDANTPYATILATYTVGAALYASVFGLLTPQIPTGLSSPYSSAITQVIARVTKVPTAADLELGIKLVI